MALPDPTPEDRALLKEICGYKEQAEPVHKKFREKGERLYAKYFSYSDFRNAYTSASPRDRDSIIGDAKREWGAELFIPYSFTVVETILPRMLSNRPRMLVLPRGKASDVNVENIKNLIDAQQEQISYELILQDIAKDGLIYGLGIQKVYWKKDIRTENYLRPRTLLGGYTVDQREVTLFDDPVAERVDPFDFIWDPYADSIEACDWVIHRTWRSTKYVMDRFTAGVWQSPIQLTQEDVQALASGSKYDEVNNERRRFQGMSNPKPAQLHEVWEFHDCERVITILDGKLIVQQGQNPAWHGEFPFQAFRPTRVPGTFAGIGEIEPIEDLQEEMNTLRSQRRDNATLKLQQVFAYSDGLIEPDYLKFGPGIAIPVNGEPRDLLMPINVGDIPNSGYMEENNLQADIERVTGISDTTTGASSAGETATGVQLVQAAANVRIQNKTRRVEVELAKPATRQFAKLSQQKIIAQRDVRVPATPTAADPERRWTWFTLGPDELAGEFAFEPEGGATQPDNVPQMRQDAQLWIMMLSNPAIGGLLDKQRALVEVFRNLGYKQPEQYIASGPDIPPATLEIMARLGVPQQVIQQALAAAEQLQQTGQMQLPPGPGQAAQDGQPQQQGSQNGQVPAQAPS